MARYLYTTSPRPATTHLPPRCQLAFDDDLETERGSKPALRSDLVRRLRPGAEIVTPSAWMFFGCRSDSEQTLMTIIVERQASISFTDTNLTLGPCSAEDFPRSFDQVRIETRPLSIPPAVAKLVQDWMKQHRRLPVGGTIRPRSQRA